MGEFKIVSNFKPTGDQPQAIKALINSIKKGERFVTLDVYKRQIYD